jgi:putative ABC transport system ATP-binding protein
VSEVVASVKNVVKAYTSDSGTQTVLRGLDLEVVEGEIVGVLGRSGSGKTTLLNILGGLDRVGHGKVTSCGLDLVGAGARDLVRYRARSVGFVFQFYNLLPTLTAAENIEAGLRVAGIHAREARTTARRALSRVGLGGYDRKFPNQLSGGEQQRVAVARAFAKKPPLLLADEPTGNLDEDTAESIIALIRELVDETRTAAIVGTHDMSVAAVTNRSLQLTHGRLEEAKLDLAPGAA